MTTPPSLTPQLVQEYQDTAAQARHKPHESKRLCANLNEILYSNLISEIRLKLASPQANIPTIERDLLRLMQQFAHEQGHSMRMRSVEQQYQRQLERQNDAAPCAFLMPAWSLLAAPSHHLRPRDMQRLPESTRKQIATLKNLIGKIGVFKSAKPNLRQNMVESMLTYRPQTPPCAIELINHLVMCESFAGIFIAAYDKQALYGNQLRYALGADPRLNDLTQGYTCHNFPVLIDELGVFGSPSGYNRAPVSENTREVIICLYSFGGIELLSYDLAQLVSRLQQYLGATIHQSQLYTGFPATLSHDVVCADRSAQTRLSCRNT